MNSFHWN